MAEKTQGYAPESTDREEGGGGIRAGIRRLMPLFFGKRSDTGYKAGISEAIANAVKPYSATSVTIIPELVDAMSRIARGDPGAPREGDRLRTGGEEDAFRMYLGLPQEHGTFGEARFRPSVGSGEDIRYQDFADPEFILNQLVPEHHSWLSAKAQQEFSEGIIDKIEDSPYYNEFMADTIPHEQRSGFSTSKKSNVIRDVARILDDNSAYGIGSSFRPISGRREEGGPFHRLEKSGLMGTYTLDKGEDEKGPYISYYDTYDLAHLPAQIAKVGQPFDIYGRMYYDPETYEPRPQTQSYTSPTGNGIRSLPRDQR